MKLDKLKTGIITVEISSLMPEKILNMLWNKRIRVSNVTKVDITTIRLDIEYNDYKEVEEVTRKRKGKIKVVGRTGMIFLLVKIKRKLSLVLGIFIFLIGLYYLSTFVWAIEIKTGKNVTPYELRRQLIELGIKPGIKKKDFDVYDVEKKIEEVNEGILWSRVRIEGSTLKVVIEEKVNPPIIDKTIELGDCTAKKDGEVKRIYITSGTANVIQGDMVKAGDVLIKGKQGKEGEEYEVPAKGIVIANTFYTKAMEVQISGEELAKTGRYDRDIYLEILGKKIYFKKAINNFKYYDKIEDNSSLFKKVTYFERDNKEVNQDREEVIKIASQQLEESLTKTLKNDAKINNRVVEVNDIGEGKIRIVVNFVVEQDIANNDF